MYLYHFNGSHNNVLKLFPSHNFIVLLLATLGSLCKIHFFFWSCAITNDTVNLLSIPVSTRFSFSFPFENLSRFIVFFYPVPFAVSSSPPSHLPPVTSFVWLIATMSTYVWNNVSEFFCYCNGISSFSFVEVVFFFSKEDNIFMYSVANRVWSSRCTVYRSASFAPWKQSQFENWRPILDHKGGIFLFVFWILGGEYNSKKKKVHLNLN